MYPTTKTSFIIAFLFSIVFIFSWEMYWRSQGYIPSVDDSKGLWAEKRALIDVTDSDQVVILGSSRAHYNFQLDEWEEVSGNRPLMLAADGKSPGPMFEDIVENTSFNGILVIGCAPGLFFAPKDSTGGWNRAKEWVDHYYDRTYAQRFNQKVSYLTDPYLAIITGDDWDSDLTLKHLVRRIPLNGRLDSQYPWFPIFGYGDIDRNMTMLDRLETDTAYAAIIQRVWTHFPPKVKFREVRTQVLGFYKNNVDKFLARGGRIVFVRNPSHMKFRENEKITHPRELYWDRLIDTTGVPGYHFEDYEVLNQFFTPEWSHLSTPDAKIYTKEFVKILQKDKVF